MPLVILGMPRSGISTVAGLAKAIDRRRMLAAMDDMRYFWRASAGFLYEKVLRTTRDLELLEQVVDIVAGEGGPIARVTLEELRGCAPSIGHRRIFERGLVRLATGTRDRGRAFVTPCDGAGNFSLVTAFPLDSSGLCEACIISIEVGGDIKESSLMGIRSSQTDDVIGAGRIFAVQKIFTEMPLAMAVAVIERACARGGVERLEHLRAVDRVVRAVPRSFAFPLPAAGEIPSLEKTVSLLRAHECKGWLFTSDELTTAGVALPSTDTVAVWVAEAARRINREERARRLLAMAEHQAVYYALAGEARAGAFAALAKEVEADAGESTLVRAMLVRTVEVATEGDEARPSVVVEGHRRKLDG